MTVDGAGSTWNTGYNGLYVGYSGSGNLSITHGGAVGSSSSVHRLQYRFVGHGHRRRRRLDLDQCGDLYVGYSGAGTLNITNGGSVSVAGATYVAPDTGSTGAINFGASGGTLTTRSLYASPTQLTGTGTINACGLVSDVNLVFDSTHGLSQTVPGFGSIAVNLDMSNSSNDGDLGAGYQGAGSLTIQNGLAVTSTNGYLGYKSGSSGTATVDGPARCGTPATTSMSATPAAESSRSPMAATSPIATYDSYVGYNSGSSGTVTVDGAGSTWNTGYYGLYVGYSGIGRLSITNGGYVSGGSITVPTSATIAARRARLPSTAPARPGTITAISMSATTAAGKLSITNGGNVSGGYGTATSATTAARRAR